MRAESASAQEPDLPRHPKTRLLRAIAIGGVVTVVVFDARKLAALGDGQWAAFVVLALVGVGTLLTLALTLPAITRRILAAPDLLVPLGVVILCDSAVTWLTVAAPTLQTPKVVQIATITLSLSVSLVLVIVIHTAFAAWMTSLIVRTVRDGDSDPCRALAGLRRWFFRVFGFGLIGWGVNFLVLAIAIPLFVTAMPLGALILGGGTLLWNFTTVALLPAAIDERVGFWNAFQNGVRESLQGIRSWIVPVLLQLALLGFITFFSISTGGGGNFSKKVNWAVNAFWIGGYKNDSHWHGKAAEVFETEPVALVSTLLALVLGVLAIAIKLKITTTIVERQVRGHAPGGRDGSRSEEMPSPPEGIASGPEDE